MVVTVCVRVVLWWKWYECVYIVCWMVVFVCVVWYGGGGGDVFAIPH